ncbi:uncharacterized protein [Euphorbia lathyris]|uniref:uncharacterized protein n=1 Tax=Euphorbia lathyris TaxID=212925 RepID=UPI003313355E
MAAEVSSLFRVLSGFTDDRTVTNDISGGKSTAAPVTKDFLGAGNGSSMNDELSQELDLDSQVPIGWEKRLDLKSGKVYLQRCNSSISPSVSSDRNQTFAAASKLQDLNFPPSKITLNLFDESHLDLKLVSSPPSASSSSRNNYQSVCTLDKVKMALERAEKEPIRKRSSLWKSSVSPSYSSSSSSIKEMQEDEDEDKLAVFSPIAAGCPGCLSYVLVMKNNPKCPRCDSIIPLPPVKKPRIDLNMSI